MTDSVGIQRASHPDCPGHVWGLSYPRVLPGGSHSVLPKARLQTVHPCFSPFLLQYGSCVNILPVKTLALHLPVAAPEGPVHPLIHAFVPLWVYSPTFICNVLYVWGY